MCIVRRFGELSGLYVQRAKSVLLFLDTAVTISAYEEKSVLRHGQTSGLFQDVHNVEVF